MVRELWEPAQSLPAQFPLVKGQVGWAKLGWPLKGQPCHIHQWMRFQSASMCFCNFEFRSFHHPALGLAAIKHHALALFCNEGCKVFFTPSAPSTQGCCSLASLSILHMNVSMAVASMSHLKRSPSCKGLDPGNLASCPACGQRLPGEPSASAQSKRILPSCQLLFP